MTEKFTTWGNRIKRNGTLLNIEFKTKLDAKLCCKLCNQMDKDNQEYIDELDEIFKWYKEYYGETILDTKMRWNEDNKILKLEKENEKLKNKLKFFMELNKPYGDIIKENEQLKQLLKSINGSFTFDDNYVSWFEDCVIVSKEGLKEISLGRVLSD